MRGALEAAELARDAALADLEQHRARGGDRPSDHSGVRVASGHYQEDEEHEEDAETHDDGMTDRMRAC